MKKSFLIVLIAAILSLGFVAANAEEAALSAPDETGAPALDSDDAAPNEVAFDAMSAGYAGVWVPFEDGFQLYLPAAWHALEPTEAQREAGLFYRAVGDGAGVAVGYARADALETVEDLRSDYGGAGFTDTGRLSLNGIDAVGFACPEVGYRGVAFFHPACPDVVMTVYFAPLGGRDAPEDALGRAILDSLSPWPAEAGE